MHKVFQSNPGYLRNTLKRCLQCPKFDMQQFSQLHSFPKNLHPNSSLNFISNGLKAPHSSKPRQQIMHFSLKAEEPTDQSGPSKGNDSLAHISHHWPEWVDLMELLLKKGYFKEAHGNPFCSGELGTKEVNCIRTACLNFAREQLGLIRFLSRKDIQVIAGCGCPNKDRKVVNSGKRLRAHVGIHEGNVCSSCNLRGECERAYVKASRDEGGRTVDVMRFLLTYGLDSIASTLENEPCQNKIVKESVRRLLKEVVEYGTQEIDADLRNGPLSSAAENQGLNVEQKGHTNIPMKQGDWLCPKCNFLNFARNIRCLRCYGLFQERLKQLKEDQDHLPLKKGDWICEKCNFLNFAKNTRCLQCKAKPPKRLLNPGEWECESCNYINFRRNMVCLKCDHRRPKASNAPKRSTQLQHDHEDNSNVRKMRFPPGENQSNHHRTVASVARNQRSPDMWGFVQEESEGNHSMLWNEDTGFADFPIAGGKSSLSQNAQKRERWKLDMLERNRNAMREEENDFLTARGKSSLLQSAHKREGKPQMLDRNGSFIRKKDEEEFGYANAQASLKYIKSSDDEDMAEWFGKTP